MCRAREASSKPQAPPWRLAREPSASLPPHRAGAQHVVLQSGGREMSDAQCRREGDRAQCPRLWPETQLLIRNSVREEAEHGSKS